MRDAYIPLFESALTSSLWSLSGDSLKLFLTLALRADPEGFVRASPGGICRLAGIPEASGKTILAALEGPDPDSKDRTRSAQATGSRIERVVDGWRIVNLEWYREQARKQVELSRKRKWWNENRGATRRDTRPTETQTETQTQTEKTRSDTESSALSSSPAAPAPDALPLVRRVFDKWRELHQHPNAKLDAKRTARIRRALATHGPEQLEQALRGALKDDWLMGRDPKSPRKYDGLETLLRDAAQIERLIELDDGKGTATPRSKGSLQRDAGVDSRKFFQQSTKGSA